jgi:DNA-binding transcriptional MerR regulator
MSAGRRYTIAELADASEAALDALGVEARNGQVRDRPDTRTIRYYGTLGLVDRPAEMSGRTALYSDRHLLQVVAVKALQARGASLAEVQRRLVGASAEELRHAIGPGLPAALTGTELTGTELTGTELTGTGVPVAAGPAAAVHGSRDDAFWRTPPAARSPALRAAARARALAEPAAAPATPSRATAGAGMQPRRVIAIPLAPGATLLVDNGGDDDPAGAADVDALRAAAGPLLAYLTGAGLLPGPPTPLGADS